MALGEILKEFGVKLTLLFDKEKAEHARKSVEEIGRGMREVALHVAEASAAIFEFANITGEHARSIEEQSNLLGINVERLQELEYAAKTVANVSRGELVGALEAVSTTLDKARHDDQMAADNLRRLGIGMDMLNDPTVRADQVMLKLSNTFAKIQDPIAKARLATEVFGSAGAKLIPLFNKGAAGIAAVGQEGRSFGVIMSKVAIEQGAEFDRQMSKVWIVLKNISFTIGNELIKYIKPLVMEFQKFIIANKMFIALGIAAIFKNVGHYIEIVFKTTKFLVEVFTKLVTAMGGLERVSKIVFLALGYLASVKIVSGVMELFKGFQLISGALGVLASPIGLISAGLVALILVIQDLTSQDSIIKEWMKIFSKEFPNATKLITGIFSVVKAAAMDTIEAFQGVFSWVMNAVGAVEKWADGINSVYSITSKVKGFFGAATGTIGKYAGAAGDFLTARSTATPSIGAASGGSPVQQSNQFEANITVGIPPGTSATKATEITQRGVEKAFEGIMRKTKTFAIGGIAY